MPKITKPLTDTEIKKSKPKDKDYKIADGQGLYIVIKKNGTKFFRYDYTYNGKRKSMSFGIYPEVSLKEARKKRENTRELLKNGIDPIITKNQKQTINTFEKISQNWLEIMKGEWKEKTYIKSKSLIEKNCYPYIRDKDIKDITRVDILHIIDTMSKRGVIESSSKLLNFLDRIYKYAVTYNYVEHNIIADIDKKNSIKKAPVKHFATITKESEIKTLLKDINSYGDLFNADISTIQALKFVPFTFLRSYTLRFLEWSEIDFEKRLLDIPSHKMKNNKDFMLPLSTQAMKILKEMRCISFENSNFVFPSQTTNLKPISENTLNHALMRMGYKGKMTIHGFRAMFSTISHEHIKEHGFSSDIIESCLAHSEQNRVKAAYNRESKTKYLDEKRELLQWWADWLTK